MVERTLQPKPKAMDQSELMSSCVQTVLVRAVHESASQKLRRSSFGPLSPALSCGDRSECCWSCGSSDRGPGLGLGRDRVGVATTGGHVSLSAACGRDHANADFDSGPDFDFVYRDSNHLTSFLAQDPHRLKLREVEEGEVAEVVEGNTIVAAGPLVVDKLDVPAFEVPWDMSDYSFHSCTQKPL